MTAQPRQTNETLLIEPAEPHDGKKERLLAVGDVPLAHITSNDWPEISGAMWIAYSDMSVDFLENLAPDIVVTNLVSRRFDCTDVARMLVEAQFSGQLRLLSNSLPKPDLVRNELQATFPALDIELWTMPTI